ncbi:hypothetical protein PybrP1_000681 [[Pythium] brassicae (nom. inval.)]|nr:hypothetical protein PybrP1_000681 [[Pythium] brassicae (nom. inval.)]
MTLASHCTRASLALDLGISHSCPVHAPHHNSGGGGGAIGGGGGSSSGRFQPPRAPFFGSLPEPSFLHVDDNPMPELLLPPPAQTRDGPPAPASVVQGNPVQHSWTPSPRALDEFDLSKSPALAVMSAAREGRAPTHNFRRVGQQQQQQSRSFSSSAGGSRDSGGFYTELMGNLSITEEEQGFSDDSADFTHRRFSARRLQHEQQQQEREHEDAAQQAFRLPAPSQSALDRRERRGSYGNMSDNGDGGVFLFEES